MHLKFPALEIAIYWLFGVYKVLPENQPLIWESLHTTHYAIRSRYDLVEQLHGNLFVIFSMEFTLWTYFGVGLFGKKPFWYLSILENNPKWTCFIYNSLYGVLLTESLNHEVMSYIWRIQRLECKRKFYICIKSSNYVHQHLSYYNYVNTRKCTLNDI